MQAMSEADASRIESWWPGLSSKRQRSLFSNEENGLSSLRTELDQVLSSKTLLNAQDIETIAMLFGSIEVDSSNVSIIETYLRRIIDSKPNLVDLANACSANGLRATQNFVQGLCALLAHQQHVAEAISKFSNQNSIIRRAWLKASHHRSMLITPEELYQAICVLAASNNNNNNIATHQVHLSMVIHRFEQWLCNSNDADVDEKDNGLFIKTLSLVTKSNVVRFLCVKCYSNSSFNYLRKEFVSTLIGFTSILQESAEARQCLGRTIQKLLIKTDYGLAHKAFQKLSEACANSSPGGEDAFELSTPLRYKTKVEEWRRLGERYRKSFHGLTSQEIMFAENQDVFSIWAQGLRGKMSMNASAMVVGCIAPRKTLSSKANAISTQPDEDGMIPAAIFLALVQIVGPMLANTNGSINQGGSDQVRLGRIICLSITLLIVRTQLPKSFVLLSETQAQECMKFASTEVASLEKYGIKRERFFVSIIGIVTELFKQNRTRIEVETARKLLYKCLFQDQTMEDKIGCFLVGEVIKTAEPSPGNEIVMGSFMEETLILNHLKRVKAKGGCATCSNGSSTTSCLYVEALWRAHLVCYRGNQTLAALTSTLEMPHPSPFKSQFEASGAIPRIQFLARSVVDHIKRSLSCSKISSLLRVLGGLCYAHPIGRTSVIEVFPWEKALNDWICGDKWRNGMMTLRTNTFVLIHEAVTNATITPQPAQFGLGGNRNQPSSLFTLRRDDSLLVEIDRKHKLASTLLVQGLDSMSMNQTASLALETCGKLVEMYRTASVLASMEESKKSMASATMDLMVSIARPERMVLFNDERFRGAFSQFIVVVVQVCPLLHQLSVLPKSDSFVSSINKCMRFLPNPIAQKILQALNTKL